MHHQCVVASFLFWSRPPNETDRHALRGQFHQTLSAKQKKLRQLAKNFHLISPTDQLNNEL